MQPDASKVKAILDYILIAQVREMLFEMNVLLYWSFSNLISFGSQGEEALEETYAASASKQLPDYSRSKRSKRSKRKRAV